MIRDDSMKWGPSRYILLRCILWYFICYLYLKYLFEAGAQKYPGSIALMTVCDWGLWKYHSRLSLFLRCMGPTLFPCKLGQFSIWVVSRSDVNDHFRSFESEGLTYFSWLSNPLSKVLLLLWKRTKLTMSKCSPVTAQNRTVVLFQLSAAVCVNVPRFMLDGRTMWFSLICCKAQVVSIFWTSS